MATVQQIAQILEQFPGDAHLRVGGGRPEHVRLAESALGLSLAGSFRTYLEKWGTISVAGFELYGLTASSDFVVSSIPDFVWFTLRLREYGLPVELLVVAQMDGDQLVCLDTSNSPGEPRVVLWDVDSKEVDEVVADCFADYLHMRLCELLAE